MEGYLYIVLAFVFLFANILAVYFIVKKFSKDIDEIKKANEDPFLMLQQQIEHIRSSVDEKFANTTQLINQSIQKQLQESARIVKEVTQELTKVTETNKQVVNFSEQLKKLQDVLLNPKQRGVLGEYYLETVLANVLPANAYKMQYRFSDGEIVDAAIFVKDKIIPVDSKFSLENYNRMLEAQTDQEKEQYLKLFKQDLKRRIDETSKYIRPQEGTVEFAFMFIPSEGIYYDLLVGQVGTGVSARDLIEYAFSKKVIIVSPTSFLAYLQTVLQGLKMLQIEESAKQIRERVEILGRHLAKYEDYYNKLGKSLATVVSHYNNGYKELAKIDKDVLKISGNSLGVEKLELDKPVIEQ